MPRARILDRASWSIGRYKMSNSRRYASKVTHMSLFYKPPAYRKCSEGKKMFISNCFEKVQKGRVMFEPELRFGLLMRLGIRPHGMRAYCHSFRKRGSMDMILLCIQMNDPNYFEEYF